MKKSLILGVCVLSACATFDSVFAMDNLDNLDNSIAKAIEIQKAAIKITNGSMNTGVVPQAEKLSDMYDSIKDTQPNLEFVNNVADTAEACIKGNSAGCNNFIKRCQDQLMASNTQLNRLSSNIDTQINGMQQSFDGVLNKYRNMVPNDAIASYENCKLLATNDNIRLKDQLSLLTQQKNALKYELRNKQSAVIAEAKRMLEEERIKAQEACDLLTKELAANAEANKKLEQELAANAEANKKLEQELAASAEANEKLKQENEALGSELTKAKKSWFGKFISFILRR